MSCEIYVCFKDGRPDKKLHLAGLNDSAGMVCFGSDDAFCFLRQDGHPDHIISEQEAEEFGIFPRHCVLLWAGGKFRLDFDRYAKVYLDGQKQAAMDWCNPFEWGQDQVGLTLGNHWTERVAQSPTFRIVRRDLDRAAFGWSDARTDNALDHPTDSIDRVNWNTKTVEQLRQSQSTAKRRNIFFATILLSALAALAFLVSQNTERLLEAERAIPFSANENTLAEIAENVGSIGLLWSEDHEQPSARSHFAPIGTGWIYRKRRDEAPSWLVTNAHVTQQILNSQAQGSSRLSKHATAKVIARFPAEGSDTGFDDIELSGVTSDETKRAYVHPFFDDFKVEYGDAAANVFDVAVYKLNEHEKTELGQRRGLTVAEEVPIEIRRAWLGVLDGKETPLASVESMELTGLGVLIVGYPVERVPFLSAGVAEEPAAHRSFVTQELNAFSRRWTLERDIELPRLIQFKAQSAGGMSGGPIIRSGQNQKPEVIGMVFAGSYRDDPDGEKLFGQNARVASSDISYGLGISSLENLLLHKDGDNTRHEILDQRLDTVAKPAWTEARSGADRLTLEFLTFEEAADCQIEVLAKHELALKLSHSVQFDGALAGQKRGEHRNGYEYYVPDHLNRLMVVARSTHSKQALIRMSVEERIRRTGNWEDQGPAYASRIIDFSNEKPNKIRINASGPLNETVEIKIYGERKCK